MIIVTGRIKTDKETLPHLYARLKALCAPSLAEEGCLFYRMAMEDEAEGVIMALEGWTSREALNEHLALPAIGQLLADFEGKFETVATVHDVSGSTPLGV